MIDEKIRYAKILVKHLRDEPKARKELEKEMIVHCGTSRKFENLRNWLLKEEIIIKMGPPRSRAPYSFNPEKVEFTNKGEVIIKI